MIIEKNMPRLLGAAFLLQAVASLISTFILTPLIVLDDIVGSMTNISNKALHVRESIIGEMIAVIGIVILGVLLYKTLKKQNRKIAIFALGLYLIVAIIITVSRIAAFSLIRISQESVRAGHSAYLQTLGNLFYELQDFGYFLHMLPYTLGATLFYYLLYKSGLIPQALNLLGLIAAPLAFIGSLFELLGVNIPMVLYLPNLPFDLGVGLWLIIKGFNSPAIVSGPTSENFS